MKQLLDDGKPRRQVVYKRTTDTTLSLFYEEPTKLQPRKVYPAIVWIHGGGWTGGDADVFFPYVYYFAQRQCVSFSVQYRLLSPKRQISIADAIADCKSAIAYIRRNAAKFHIDPNKIVVIGDSAGGHLAACTAYLDDFDEPNRNEKFSSKPNLVVLCNPGLDLSVPAWIKVVIGGKALAKNALPADLIPTDLQLQMAKKVSPLYHVKAGRPPALIMHGLDDKVIPPQQSIVFSDSLTKYKIDHQLILLPNTRHAFIVPHYTATEQAVVNVMCTIDSFLVAKKYLLPGINLKTFSDRPAWIIKSKPLVK